jgi:hypothetical protein
MRHKDYDKNAIESSDGPILTASALGQRFCWLRSVFVAPNYKSNNIGASGNVRRGLEVCSTSCLYF